MFLKNKAILLLVLLIVICVLSYLAPKFVLQTMRIDKYQNIEQGLLLNEIRELTEKPLKSVVVESPESSTKEFRKEFKKSVEIQQIVDFLKAADKKPAVGGHVWPIYECTMTFKLKDKQSAKLLVKVFSDKPTDAFFYHMVSIYDKKDGSSEWAMKPVCVSGFGSWLRSTDPRGKEGN